jgi:hypothetical protein
MTPEGKSWRDLYEFDTPVVRQFEGRVAEFHLLTFMSNTDPCQQLQERGRASSHGIYSKKVNA